MSALREQQGVETQTAVAVAEEPLADDLFHFGAIFSKIGRDHGQGVLVAPAVVGLIRKEFPRLKHLLAASQRQRQHDQRGVGFQFRRTAGRELDLALWCVRPACVFLLVVDELDGSVRRVALAGKDLARRHFDQSPFGQAAIGGEDEVRAKAVGGFAVVSIA